jgi:hypothetical protein
VPYSLALRLVRIFSEQRTQEKRLEGLEEMLLSRKYNKNVVREELKKPYK